MTPEIIFVVVSIRENFIEFPILYIFKYLDDMIKIMRVVYLPTRVDNLWDAILSMFRRQLYFSCARFLWCSFWSARCFTHNKDHCISSLVLKALYLCNKVYSIYLCKNISRRVVIDNNNILLHYEQ